jgi:hypothetical protein
MVLGEFVIFPHIDEMEPLTPVEPSLHLGCAALLDTPFRLVDKLQKAWVMLHHYYSSPSKQRRLFEA